MSICSREIDQILCCFDAPRCRIYQSSGSQFNHLVARGFCKRCLLKSNITEPCKSSTWIECGRFKGPEHHEAFHPQKKPRDHAAVGTIAERGKQAGLTHVMTGPLPVHRHSGRPTARARARSRTPRAETATTIQMRRRRERTNAAPNSEFLVVGATLLLC
ncbi:hypothetical protein L596_024779 [Steinernema carpocapsae]|uniref:Uncharacterized protein n=1 Tax=Steinernema carpocapsae TaxID=34508 RepID=A0A4V5ZYL7_STECR|nr:hypothetical protein L596_024779 [Steinernema carpocapsae]